MEEKATVSYRDQSWDAAVDTFGTAKIFSRRGRSLVLRLRVLAYLGLAGPLLLGGLLSVLGITSKLLPRLAVATGLVGVTQLLVSAWSLVAGWPDELNYANESEQEHMLLSSQFKQLAQAPPLEQEMTQQVQRLQVTQQARERHDSKRRLTEKERRFGLRWGLFEFQRACGICKKVPDTLEPTPCKNCGEFPERWIR